MYGNIDDNNIHNDNNDNINLNIEKIIKKWEAQYAKDKIRINTIINGNDGKTVENNLKEEITLLKSGTSTLHNYCDMRIVSPYYYRGGPEHRKKVRTHT